MQTAKDFFLLFKFIIYNDNNRINVYLEYLMILLVVETNIKCSL